MTNWRKISQEAALSSHRLIGWIYWDPYGETQYEKLGIPNGFGYYITTRAGSLGKAGPNPVIAAFYSINPDFIRSSYQMLNEHSDTTAATQIRDDTILNGLRSYVPEICEDLSSMSDSLWNVADSLPASGRAMFAAQLDHRRPDEPLINAWLAINCIREWRGDTHWAIQIAEGFTGVEAGILDGAWRNYDADWLARSRGADDETLRVAYESLEGRGLARNGAVTELGLAHRQSLEDRLNDLSSTAWKIFGELETINLIDLIETVGEILLNRIDQTGGSKWMPAARQ